MLQALRRALEKDIKPFHASQWAIPKIREVRDVEDVLRIIIELCIRNNQRLDEQDSQSLWFKSFDEFVLAQRAYRKELQRHQLAGTADPPAVRKMLSCLNSFIQNLLAEMSNCVSLPAILTKIVSDHGSDFFGDYRQTLMGMLETYRYEGTLLSTAYDLLEGDQYRALRLLLRKKATAFSTSQPGCAICELELSKLPGISQSEKESSTDTTAVPTECMLFTCGHAFHKYCLPASVTTDLNDGIHVAACPCCDSETNSKLVQTHRKHAASSKNTLPVVDESDRYVMETSRIIIEKLQQVDSLWGHDSGAYSRQGKTAFMDGLASSVRLQLRPKATYEESPVLTGERVPGTLPEDSLCYMELPNEILDELEADLF